MRVKTEKLWHVELAVVVAIIMQNTSLGTSRYYLAFVSLATIGLVAARAINIFG